jgi:hypothetical protein
MIRKICLFAILGVCASLLVVAVPAAAQAAEPSAQHASKKDAKVVCHRVKKSGSNTRERECMTKGQWRAARDSEPVCHWGKRPGSQIKEQFCMTAAEWRTYAARAGATFTPGGFEGTSPAAPGTTNFGGTAASQSSFQR